jgi:hypothetical protein
MTTGEKISFSFASTSIGGALAAPPNAPATKAPLSNMELLMAKAKAQPPQSATSTKPKTRAPIAFDDEEDDSTSGPVASSAQLKSKLKPDPRDLLEGGASSHINRNTTMSRAEKRLQSEALALDSTAFQYDEVYDHLKAAERKVEEAKKMEKNEGKPKYMDSFLEAARRRKMDALHAEEKMMQIERAKEGGEFDDKEKFVTAAYKAQMEEVRRAEEEERIKEGESSPFTSSQVRVGADYCRTIEE